MYSRYPNYRFGGIKIPENYSGNAFSEPTEVEVASDEVAEEVEAVDAVDAVEEAKEKIEAVKTSEDSVSASLSRSRRGLPFGFKFDLRRLFSGGVGFEEILLIAVILLVSQNDSGDELILLLALLLFVE